MDRGRARFGSIARTSYPIENRRRYQRALAFWIHPEQWGKGYATEGAQRILRFGFEKLGAKTIWASAGKWNTGSNRVLEKLGMKYINNNPQNYSSKGEPIPTYEYEILREIWKIKEQKLEVEYVDYLGWIL